MGLSRLEWLNLDHSHTFDMYVGKTLIQFRTLIVLYIIIFDTLQFIYSLCIKTFFMMANDNWYIKHLSKGYQPNKGQLNWGNNGKWKKCIRQKMCKAKRIKKFYLILTQLICRETNKNIISFLYLPSHIKVKSIFLLHFPWRMVLLRRFAWKLKRCAKDFRW